LEAALKVASESEFDALMGPRNRAAEIRKRYQDVKTEFQTTVCENCGTKRTQPSWDMDAPAMVHKLGGLYRHFYLPNYSVPNFHIHATLASSTFEGCRFCPSGSRPSSCLRHLSDASFVAISGINIPPGVREGAGSVRASIVNLRPQREQS
jgi:hypothetical protein